MATLEYIDGSRPAGAPRGSNAPLPAQRPRTPRTPRPTPDTGTIQRILRERLDRAEHFAGSATEFTRAKTSAGDDYVKLRFSGRSPSGNTLNSVTVMAFGPDEIRWLGLDGNQAKTTLLIARERNLYRPAGPVHMNATRQEHVPAGTGEAEVDSSHAHADNGLDEDDGMSSYGPTVHTEGALDDSEIPMSAYEDIDGHATEPAWEIDDQPCPF